MKKFSCVGNSSCEKSIKIRENAHTRKVRRENKGPCKGKVGCFRNPSLLYYSLSNAHGLRIIAI